MAEMRGIAEGLRDRSARLVGTMIGTMVKTFPEEFGEETVVPIEGSVFWGIPGYAQLVEAAVREVTSVKVRFLNVPQAGILGAAAAALTFK